MNASVRVIAEHGDAEDVGALLVAALTHYGIRAEPRVQALGGAAGFAVEVFLPATVAPPATPTVAAEEKRAAVRGYLRCLGAGELQGLLRDAKIASGWAGYDSEGCPIDEDDTAAYGGNDDVDSDEGDDANRHLWVEWCDGVYLQSIEDNRTIAVIDSSAHWWKLYGHPPTTPPQVVEKRHVPEGSAWPVIMREIEEAAETLGWRIPWRNAATAGGAS